MCLKQIWVCLQLLARLIKEAVYMHKVAWVALQRMLRLHKLQYSEEDFMQSEWWRLMLLIASSHVSVM